MTSRRARPIFIVFFLCLFGVVGVIAWSMQWVDAHRHRAPVHSGASQPLPDMYAPD